MDLAKSLVRRYVNNFRLIIIGIVSILLISITLIFIFLRLENLTKEMFSFVISIFFISILWLFPLYLCIVFCVDQIKIVHSKKLFSKTDDLIYLKIKNKSIREIIQKNNIKMKVFLVKQEEFDKIVNLIHKDLKVIRNKIK